MAQRTVNLGSFAPGVNNRLEPSELATVLADRSKGTYLYGADNVDINDKGFLRRRRGTTQRIAGAAHSLWADARSAEAFAVVDDQLERLTEGGTTLQRAVVRAGMPRLPVSYSRGADGAVYWSNGQVIRRVEAGVDRPVATEPPPLVPTVTVTSGALRAGKYLLAFTALSDDGESPATPAVQVDVPDNGGVAVDSVTEVQVFMSAPDGDILTWQAAGTDPSVLVHNETGRRCMTLNRALMPAGSIVRHYNGCLLVASGTLLFISDPYNYGLYNPSKSFIALPAAINLLEPTDNGVYIGADKTYWLHDFFGGDLQEVLPYGATPGTSGRSPNDDTVFWHSDRGLVVAGKNQDVKNVQEEALEFSAASSGASLFRERNGMTHIVTSRAGVQTNVAAASTFMEAEVIRKGTTL